MPVRAVSVVICWFLLALSVGAEDAGPVRALTRGSMDIGWPRWSPDGSKIAFWGLASGGLGIRVVNPDGSDLQLVTDPATTAPGLHGWAPDGSSIVYATHHDEGLLLHSLDTKATARLRGTLSPAGSPAWSPDGKTIALASREKQFEGIYLFAVDGTMARRLPSPAGRLWSPTWSRDGSSILVCAQDDTGTHMWRTRADGAGMEKLMRLEGISGITGFNVAWSPNAEWVVYARSGRENLASPGPSSLYAASIDGERLIRVTDHHGAADDHPAWSPDGREIAFLRYPGGRHSIEPFHIAVIDVSRLFPDVVEAAARSRRQDQAERR